MMFGQSVNNHSTHYPEPLSELFQKTNTFVSLVDVNYYNFRNTEKYQGNQEVRINLQPDFSVSKDSQDTIKIKSLTGVISLRSQNRFYNRSGFFLEAGHSFSFNPNVNKFTRTEISGEANRSVIRSTHSLPVSIGFGRIEPVEDARLAIYIIDELTKKGKIKNPPSETVITEFARKISEIKRKRFFDTRLRKIEELQTVDSFLIGNDLVSSGDIEYFTILGDQWDYASGPARKAGFSVNAGFDNSVDINKRSEYYSVFDPELSSMVYENIITKTNNYKAGGFLRIDYSKPHSLYWQSDLYSLTSLGRVFTRNPSDKEDIEENYETNIFYTSLNYSVRYLPNSRTSIGLTVGGNYEKSAGNRSRSDISGPIAGDFSEQELTLNAWVDMYYYFSPQLRIVLDFNMDSLNHNWVIDYTSVFEDSSLKSSYFSDNFSVGFVYSFF